ncbi:MAG TPA: nucleotidyltransferase [Solirubrobacterales bacterium]
MKEARARRDLFRKAFEPESDVIEVIPSGSLARSTQREPINDVDVIIVFNAADHPGWGQDGSSADDALGYLQQRVKDLLGANGGSVEQAVRRVDRKNHAVKCFLDDPGDPDAFTVDAMPALRQPTGELLVPERRSETWIRTDPEHLIRRVAERQSDWDLFRPLVRVLKYWNETAKAGMKSLTVEVLALANLSEESTRPKALQRFFAAAVNAVDLPIEDPAGHCGETQPDLDRDHARACLDDAASKAWHAVNAQDAGETDRAGCLWREVMRSLNQMEAARRTTRATPKPASTSRWELALAPSGSIGPGR